MAERTTPDVGRKLNAVIRRLIQGGLPKNTEAPVKNLDTRIGPLPDQSVLRK